MRFLSVFGFLVLVVALSYVVTWLIWRHYRQPKPEPETVTYWHNAGRITTTAEASLFTAPNQHLWFTNGSLPCQDTPRTPDWDSWRLWRTQTGDLRLMDANGTKYKLVPVEGE